MGSPPRSGVVSIATLAAVVISTGGCSFFFVNGPPPNHRSLSFFGCTSSNTIPFVDAALGAGSAVEALVGASDVNGTSRDARVATAVTYGAAAALFAASAAHGFGKTSECRQAQADLVARLPPPAPMPALAAPVPYDPWVARPAPPPPVEGLPSVTPAPRPAAVSPWETPNPGP